MLLSGPPGTGKTLMAEAVADRTRRPLFYLQAEDLGINAAVLGANIKKVFQMATEWDAVILLDEADVFMAERHPQDIARNELGAWQLNGREIKTAVKDDQDVVRPQGVCPDAVAAGERHQGDEPAREQAHPRAGHVAVRRVTLPGRYRTGIYGGVFRRRLGILIEMIIAPVQGQIRPAR
jgi:SpoVK/Ycf46/Vps4 family AAA+-type ATPase